jgi:hypothetical protein
MKIDPGAKSSNFLGARASCPNMAAKNTENAGRMPALPGNIHMSVNATTLFLITGRLKACPTYRFLTLLPISSHFFKNEMGLDQIY